MADHTPSNADDDAEANPAVHFGETVAPADAQIVINGENLRGLAHPLRMRLLGRLRSGGPATASALAREFDTTSGDVSYHLRQLARFGFIIEADRGTKRERWWQAQHIQSEFDELSLDPQDRELARWLGNQVVAMAIERLGRASDSWRNWPDDWQPTFTASDVLLELTPEEALDLRQQVFSLLSSYRHRQTDSAPIEGTRTVTVQYQSFLYEDPPR